MRLSLFLLLAHAYAADLNFLRGADVHSEIDGVLDVSLPEADALLDSEPREVVQGERSVVTAFSASSRATVSQAKPQLSGSGGRLVGWFLSSWTGKIS